MQYSGQPVDQIAAAEEINTLRSDRKPAVGTRVENILKAVRKVQVRLLCVVIVVQNDLAPRKAVQVSVVSRNTRRVAFRELARPPALVQLDLAEARKIGVFRDG